MAFVQNIPGRFIESFHGTCLSLSFSRDLKTFSGRYAPAVPSKPDTTAPSNSSSSLLAFHDNVLKERHGLKRLSRLCGTVRHEVSEGTITLSLVGRWVHLDAENQGPFRIALSQAPHAVGSYSAVGWWSDDDDPSTQVEWEWTADADTDTTAFFRFIHGNSFTKFSICTAWLFLALTVVSLYCSLKKHTLPTLVTCTFDFLYSAIYTFFCLTYVKMKNRPHPSYIFGVLLYLVGYVVFAALTVASEFWEDEPRDLYTIGSVMFAIGSLFLVSSTVGPDPRKMEGDLTSFLKNWSLFVGSLAFFIGSAAFVVDSFVTNPANAKIGYSWFVLGRLCFLWGSTTEKVNWLLQKEARRGN